MLSNGFQVCVVRLGSSSPKVVSIGWTLIYHRSIFAATASTQATRLKLEGWNLTLHNMLHFQSLFGFGLMVRVEAVQTKKSLAASMSTL